MANLLARLERLNAALTPRQPWMNACGQCRAEGRSDTPYEHCEAKRCDAGHRAIGALAPDHIERIREGFYTSEELAGRNPEETLRDCEAANLRRREAWDAKKRDLSRA